MIKKLTLAVGIGAGYVLGAKAGHQRYEQIVGKARELAGKPAVQDFTANVSNTASTVADKAKGTVNDKVAAVNDKVAGTSTDAQVVDLAQTTPAFVGTLDASAPVITTPPIPDAAPSATAPDSF